MNYQRKHHGIHCPGQGERAAPHRIVEAGVANECVCRASVIEVVHVPARRNVDLNQQSKQCNTEFQCEADLIKTIIRSRAPFRKHFEWRRYWQYHRQLSPPQPCWSQSIVVQFGSRKPLYSRFATPCSCESSSFTSVQSQTPIFCETESAAT